MQFVRTDEEIQEVMQELFDEVWYDYHLVKRWDVKTGRIQVAPETWEKALAKARKLEEKGIIENDDDGHYAIVGELFAFMWLLGKAEWKEGLPLFPIDGEKMP